MTKKTITTKLKTSRMPDPIILKITTEPVELRTIETDLLPNQYEYMRSYRYLMLKY